MHQQQEHLKQLLQSLAAKLPEQQAQQLSQQMQLWTTQVQRVQEITARQVELTNVRTERSSKLAAAAPQAPTKQPSALPNAPKSPASAQLPPPLALDAKLPMTSDELLFAVFGVADSLGPEYLHALAAVSGEGHDHVRQFYSKLRTSVRTSVQRMRTRAAKDGALQAAQPAVLETAGKTCN